MLNQIIKITLKKDMEAAIVSINYFIFDSTTPSLNLILDVIKKNMSDTDSDMDLSSDEFEDRYKIGLSNESQDKYIIKKNWELKDKELRNNSTFVDFYNIPRNLLYSSDIIFSIVSNELFKLKNQKCEKYQIHIPEDNIYNFKVRYNFPDSDSLNKQLQQVNKNFGYNYIEINLSLNMNLYPFFPPSIKIMRPKINNSIIYGIMDLEFLKYENWNPTNSLEFVINAIHQVLEKHALIMVDSPLNNLDLSYLPLEYSLMQLSSKYKLVSQTSEEIDVEYTKLSNNSSSNQDKNSSNKYWKSGVGYGHSNRKEWDINAYIRDQERIDKELSDEINKITHEIETFDQTKYDMNLKDVVQPSCLFTLIKNRLLGITMMEIDKNTNIYTSIINSIKVISQKNLWKFDQIFDQISTSINNISKESESLIKIITDTKSKDIIDPIYTEILAVNDLIQAIQKPILSVKKSLNSDSDTESIYMENLKPLQFSNMNIINDEKVEFKFRKQDNISSYKPKSLMRIVKEISALSSSLPLSFSSTVFMRPDTNNVNSIKFMITGPKDTPYESGCFEFDAYFTSSFPESPPKVLLLTTGGGRVRFNPNLYNCGKVCLSLLGTWSGQKGESWNKDTSTFLQVLVSIQSLIMVDEPYFNEPGWEREMHTEAGKKKSFDYNDNIRFQTLKWAIVDKLKNPTIGFEEVIKKHFYYKKDYLVKQIEQWLSETKKNKDEFVKYKDEAIELLNKIEI